MQKMATHLVLVNGDSYEKCQGHVTKFFELTSLVNYDRIDISKKKSVAATDPEFDARLNGAIAHNKNTLKNFVIELEQAGLKTSADLLELESGYPSKTLHIVAHFLDGFIGIDSFFYNLIDDSHWLPSTTRSAVEKEKEHHWLIYLEGYSGTPELAAVLNM